MPTITLDNIPDRLYHRLKQAADAHHRSIDSEVLHCLERVLLANDQNVEATLERARQIRSSLPAAGFTAKEIAEAIDQGRP